MKKYPTTKSKKIYDIVSDSDNDIESLVVRSPEVKPKNGIDLCNNVFDYLGKKFNFIKVGDKFYFKGKEIAEALGYVDTKSALQDHVSKEYKIKLGDIFKGGKTPPLDFKVSKSESDTLKKSKKSADRIDEDMPPTKKLMKTNGRKSHCIKDSDDDLDEIFNLADLAGLKFVGNEKNTIYITESGLYQFLLSSNKAKEFRHFVLEDVLPTLRKTGTYSVKLTLILDTSSVKSFYNDNNITDFIGKFVCYLGVIGFYKTQKGIRQNFMLVFVWFCAYTHKTIQKLT